MNKLKKSSFSARQVAVNILVEVFYRQAFSNLALDRGLRRFRLEPADRRLVTEIVNGTVKMAKHLDWVLSLFLTSRQKLNPYVKMILWSGLYQILFLEKVPAYAAVSEAVDMAKRVGEGSAKLVNAVLRRVEREKHELEYPDPEKNPVMYLAVVYSHPEWMVERWLLRYGWEDTVELLTFNNSSPELSVRANFIKVDREGLINRLEQEKVKAKEGRICPCGVIIEELPLPISELSSYQEGLFYVQQESVMLIALALAPHKGDVVLDLCCGVGGKSTHLAEIMNNEGKIKAVDLYPHKLELLKANCRRLGVEIVEGVALDLLQASDLGMADHVLLDAPCTGTGVLRSRADLRWRRSREDLEKMSEKQVELVKAASRYVPQGGRLAYCTCSLEPEENEEVVMRFLQEHQNFRLLDLSDYLSFFPFAKEDKSRAEGGLLTIFPPLYRNEGVFISLLERRI